MKLPLHPCLNLPAAAGRYPWLRRAGNVLLLSGALLSPLSATAAVQDVLGVIKQDLLEETAHISAREQRFKAELGSQQQLLSEINAEVAALEQARNQLKVSFDANEAELTELTALLDRRSGDLGELFGVFRQTASDTQAMIYDSLVSLENPARTGVIDGLAELDSVPSIEQIQGLWSVLVDEIAGAGTVSTFETIIVSPDGSQSRGEVVRVGTFNLISGDKFLTYLPDSGKAVELARQPAGYVLDSAADLSGAAPGAEVPFYLDPSRGVLLSLLVQSPSFMERIEQGQLVGHCIIALTVIGLGLVLQRMLVLGRISRRIRRQQQNMDQIESDNPLGRALAAFYENKHLSVEVISRKLDEVIFKDIGEIRKGLSTLKVLAAVAPLMGLLGTVTGMIGTFQAITLFGTGDPKLMAGGISQALVTTVEGLVAAIPLLLAHSLLSSRAADLTKILGEQAAGMVAEQARLLEQRKA